LGQNWGTTIDMSIPVTLILYIFVGIMSLYAIHLDAASLFADSLFVQGKC